MGTPHLTLACELDAERLGALFSRQAIISDLQALEARVALMVSDLSKERAAVVKQLNSAGIPVVGIPLLPLQEGYYFTMNNPHRAAQRYVEWKTWSARHDLAWDGVGLDIEPDASVYLQLMRNPWGLLPMLLPRVLDRQQPRRARQAYAELVEQIHADGYRVENYQFPLIGDERRIGSTLLQRLLGLVDVRTDREVWMLYTSVLSALGPGLLAVYASEAAAIGVGSTGGGPDIPGHPQVPALDWAGLSRDLRLAHRWTDEILIHSLEGCVWQGFLGPLRTFDWGAPEPLPPTMMLAFALRRVLWALLWGSTHPLMTVTAIAVIASLAWRRRR